MSDAGPLIVERKGGVVSLRFNRPAVLNAINAEMAEAIAKAVAEARADSGVRCMIISGEGRAFMAGGDVATFHAAGTEAPAEIKRLIGPLHEALAQMAEAPFPVIASIRGAAVGGGFSVALAADVAIAADDAQFAHGYTKIGASTDCSGSWNLPRLVGLRRALGLALLEDTIDAQTALSYGLVNRVVPAETLEAETWKMANRLAAGSATALARTKALMRASSGRDLRSQLDAEREAFLAGAATPDFAEGASAFVERRKPNFS